MSCLRSPCGELQSHVCVTSKPLSFLFHLTNSFLSILQCELEYWAEGLDVLQLDRMARALRYSSLFLKDWIRTYSNLGSTPLPLPPSPRFQPMQVHIFQFNCLCPVITHTSSTVIFFSKLWKTSIRCISNLQCFLGFQACSISLWIPLTLPCVCLVAQSCLTLRPLVDYSLPGSSVPGDSPGKNTRMGCHAILQGNLPNSGIEPRSPAL